MRASALVKLYIFVSGLGAGLSASRRAWERVSLHEPLETLKNQFLLIMKKTIIALMALAGVAAADSLTLTTTCNSETGVLTWTENTGELTAWELSFDITATSISNLYIFQAAKDKSAWLPTVDFWDSKIEFNQCEKGGADQLGKVSILANETASITLSFIADQSVTGEYVGGTYSVSFKQGETTFSNSVEISSFTSERTLSDYSISSGEPKFTTDNRVTISNISLTQLNAVPEPTTATLSLLALAGLAARRRRK